MTKSELISRLDVLTKAIYATPEGGAGCCLHIVLDDGNIEDSNIEYCIAHAKHGICREVGELLLQLTPDGREVALEDGFTNFYGVKENQILDQPDDERLRKLEDAIAWVLSDASYKAPEQISTEAKRWIAHLTRAIQKN